jgi:hypothetical protein
MTQVIIQFATNDHIFPIEQLPPTFALSYHVFSGWELFNQAMAVNDVRVWVGDQLVLDLFKQEQNNEPDTDSVQDV